MNNPRMNSIIEKLRVNPINEGVVRDKKTLDILCKDFIKYLNGSNLNYEDIWVNNGKVIASISGDWKHDHLYFKQLADNFFKDRGYKINDIQKVTSNDGSDCYDANHYITITESVNEDVDEIIEGMVTDNIKDKIYGLVSDSVMDRLETLLKKFTDVPFSDMQFIKQNGRNLDLINTNVIIYFLKDGLSTDDENKGVVVILSAPKKRVHLIDTEILDNGYYKNTIIYNESELDLMSKEVWSCVLGGWEIR